MKTIYGFLASLLTLAMLSACDSASDIVRNGTMDGYESTTIGKAFDNAFDSPNWDNFETANGQKVVEFNGQISKRLHDHVVASALGQLDKAVEDTYAGFSSSDNGKKMIEEQKLFSRFKAAVGVILQMKSQESLRSIARELKCERDDIATPCKDDKRQKQYMVKVVDLFSDVFWAAGTPVTFQWTINIDGKTFELTALTSPAWDWNKDNMKLEDIIGPIYGL